MKTEILKLIVCPACKQSLTLATREEAGGEVMEGALRCGRCGASFPITYGIPRFAAQLGERQQIAESFGFQWKARDEGQFEEGTLYGLSPAEELEVFFRAFDITPQELKGKTLLDAGCGDGFLDRLLSKYPAEIIGIDINTSIVKTYEICKSYPNVTVIEADLLHPPFRPHTFDVVWSEGVIVHTGDPKRAFTSLAHLVKPGGKLYVWVYPSDGLSIYQRIRDLLVAPYRFPKPVLLSLSHLLAVPIYVAAKSYAVWKRRRGTSGDSRSSVRSVAFSLFDNLSPRYQSRHTVAEVRGWFEELGFSDLKQTGRIGMSGIRME